MNQSSFFTRLPLWIAILAAAVGLTLEFTLLRGYASHWWNHVPAFYLLYGALAAIALLGLSIWGSKVLNRQEAAGTNEKEA